MTEIKRVYSSIVEQHLNNERQMVFISGPRQVGKTTLCENFQTKYFNWDKLSDRAILLSGEDAVASSIGINMMRRDLPIVTFDEIHHFHSWKRFLKGFFDIYGKKTKILVTGSARLDIYKRGGDSLMGRYFPYRMHPLSVGELAGTEVRETELRPLSRDIADFDRLMAFGGFPEPFSRADRLFLNRWRRLRFDQLVREDIRKDTSIRELDQIEMLARILSERSGEQIVYASLANEIQMNEMTIRKWIATLGSFFFGFRVRPWSRHIANAIRKTPKWYLRDWSGVADEGKRNETFIACHLLKAVEYWTDVGFGDYELFYLRDKQKREVDFLVSRDGAPWFIVEVKSSETRLSPHLAAFQRMTGVKHAFQVVCDLPFEEIDCFSASNPVIVPARSFLSQLP